MLSQNVPRLMSGQDFLQGDEQTVSGWLSGCFYELGVLQVDFPMVSGWLIGNAYGLGVLLVEKELGWRLLVFHREKLEVGERMIC